MSNEGLTPVKIIFDEEHSCDGVLIDKVTYSPFTVYDETHDLRDAKQVAEIICNIEYDYAAIETLLKDKLMHSNDKTKTVKEPRPLHYTFYSQPNGNGLNRAMYRTGMKWSEEYKETKRRVKHIALPHRIRRTVLHFLAKVRRSLRGDKGLLPS